jgi:redox-sensitive bicupin YhaK (pirin superfamily)
MKYRLAIRCLNMYIEKAGATMITIRNSDERGHFDFGWLDTRHSFSFGDYQDPAHDRFHALRVLNEDRVQPGRGFGTHGHRDMEIFTWVLSGTLAHKDSSGRSGLLGPGDAQRMSAGTGIAHSEFNGSQTEPVHFLQIWLLPEQVGLKPDYEQKAFPPAERRNQLRLLASRGGRDGSVHWSQDAALYGALLDAGAGVERPLGPGRAAWVQVASGSVEVNGHRLGAGDGAALEGESLLRLRAVDSAEVLVFDLA